MNTILARVSAENATWCHGLRTLSAEHRLRPILVQSTMSFGLDPTQAMAQRSTSHTHQSGHGGGHEHKHGGHGRGHDHAHAGSAAMTARALWIALALTAGFAII